jgi:hypothetical protein
MAEEQGVPARELSDDELERQGVQAHATRHWVFLHGTAEQFRTHTQRMLELEQEYLRRHPQRTWQGRDDTGLRATGTGSDADRAVAQARLLTEFAQAPGGRMHKLEAHQLARQVVSDARLVAALYKQNPPLLRTDGDQREITEAGRAWLAAHSDS